MGLLGQSDERDVGVHAPVIDPTESQLWPEPDVRADGAPGDQARRLEHERAAGPGAPGGFAADADAAGCWEHEATERAEQRRLPRAGRPQDAEEFALVDIEGQPVEDPAVAEAHDEVADLDECGHSRKIRAAFPPRIASLPSPSSSARRAVSTPRESGMFTGG